MPTVEMRPYVRVHPLRMQCSLRGGSIAYRGIACGGGNGAWRANVRRMQGRAAEQGPGWGWETGRWSSWERAAAQSGKTPTAAILRGRGCAAHPDRNHDLLPHGLPRRVLPLDLLVGVPCGAVEVKRVSRGFSTGVGKKRGKAAAARGRAHLYTHRPQTTLDRKYSMYVRSTLAIHPWTMSGRAAGIAGEERQGRNRSDQ